MNPSTTCYNVLGIVLYNIQGQVEFLCLILHCKCKVYMYSSYSVHSDNSCRK